MYVHDDKIQKKNINKTNQGRSILGRFAMTKFWPKKMGIT